MSNRGTTYNVLQWHGGCQIQFLETKYQQGKLLNRCMYILNIE